MDKPVLNVLLVEDDQATLKAIRSLIESEVGEGRTDCELRFVEAYSGTEALAQISQTHPDLILTDLHVGQDQTGILDFIQDVLNNLMSRNARTIVISGRLEGWQGDFSQAGRREHDLAKYLSRELKVRAQFHKPFDNGELVSVVEGQITDIIEEHRSSTGLPGLVPSELDLEFILEHRGVATVILRIDLRKIGLAANDPYHTDFGNEIINLFASILKRNLGLLPGDDLERVAHQTGGDEFQVAIRSKTRRMDEVQRAARVLCFRIGQEFDREIRQFYQGRESYFDGILVGPNVKNKEGSFVVVPVPCARISIIPVYPDVITEKVHVVIIDNHLQADLKRQDNQRERIANQILGLPAHELPVYSPEEFNRRVKEARAVLDRGWSRFAVARKSTARQLLYHSARSGNGKGERRGGTQ